MHAILGLAASDLMQKDGTLVTSAMHHRLKAIKAIKKTLSDVPKADAFEEGNALMATCFALTFQSVMLEDGINEYMTFIRGVLVVAIQMYVKGAKLLFEDFINDKSRDEMQPVLKDAPLVEKAWADAALLSIENLAPLCQDDVQRQYHEKILIMAQQLHVSSWGGKSSGFHPIIIWLGN
jgi:hypothetical protein